jgi:hypothetical protein
MFLRGRCHPELIMTEVRKDSLNNSVSPNYDLCITGG